MGTGAIGEDELGESSSLTREGAIIGTLPYMAPEQVGEGDSDARTDIHALGAILYELLAEHPPYEGRTPAALAVEILRGTPPPIAEIEPSTPESLIRVVDRCLEKDPADRWQSARDLASELRWITDSKGEMLLPAGATETKRKSKRSWSRITVNLTLATGVLWVLSVVARGAWQSAVESGQRLEHFNLFAPPGLVFSQNHQDAVVSPDGETALFVAVDSSGQRLLWSQSMFTPDFEAVDAEEGAHTPFWSPDGHRIGYFHGTDLRILNLRDRGPSELLATVSLEARGGSWGRDGVVLYSPGPQGGVFRVSRGSQAEPVTIPDRSKGEIGHLWPHFLPDGNHFLYLVRSTIDTVQGVYVASLDAPVGRRVLPSATSAAYASGHMLFLREGRLLAQQFDPGDEEPTGPIIELVENVASTSTLQAGFSASEDVLTYSSGATRDVTELVWYDVNGRSYERVGQPQRHRNPSLSRDGRHLAVELGGEAAQHIWTLDFSTGQQNRTRDLTPGARNPVWSPDGRSLAFVSVEAGGWGIYRWDLNSAAPPEKLFSSRTEPNLTDWSPDGRTLLYAERTDRGDYDIMALDLSTLKPTWILGEVAHQELTARFSPSGSFIAYVSNESENYEVYVEPFPPSGRRCQISSEGGWEPEWGGSDDVLYFMQETGEIMVADVVMMDACADAPPRQLFKARMGEPRTSRNHYVYSTENGRFLINSISSDPRTYTIEVLQNWTKALERAGN